jgi:hypothetical protein
LEIHFDKTGSLNSIFIERQCVSLKVLRFSISVVVDRQAEMAWRNLTHKDFELLRMIYSASFELPIQLNPIQHRAEILLKWAKEHFAIPGVTSRLDKVQPTWVKDLADASYFLISARRYAERFRSDRSSINSRSLLTAGGARLSGHVGR